MYCIIISFINDLIVKFFTKTAAVSVYLRGPENQKVWENPSKKEEKYK